MKVQRLLVMAGIAGVVSLVLIVVAVVYWQSHLPDLPVARIQAAADTYVAQEVAQGRPAPSSISLRDLLDRGLLDRASLKGLEGIEMTLHLTASEDRPQDVIARIRLPNEPDLVALGDGSVQHMPR